MKPFTFYNIYVNYNIFKIAATNSDSTGTRFRAAKFHSWLRHQRGAPSTEAPWGTATCVQGAGHTFLRVNLQDQRHVCTDMNAHTLILSRYQLLLLYFILLVLWSFNADDPEYSFHIFILTFKDFYESYDRLEHEVLIFSSSSINLIF